MNRFPRRMFSCNEKQWLTRHNKYFLLLILIISNPLYLLCLDKDSDYTLSTEIFAGWSYKLNSELAGEPSYSRSGLPVGLRIMWEPDNLLRVGIESAYLKLSSFEKQGIETKYGTTNAKASLNAVPILLIFSMNKWNFDISTGLGVYYLYATFDAKLINSVQQSGEWDMGFLLSIGYTYPFDGPFSVGANLKYYSISERQEYLISPQISLKYNVFTW